MNQWGSIYSHSTILRRTFVCFCGYGTVLNEKIKKINIRKFCSKFWIIFGVPVGMKIQRVERQTDWVFSIV